MGCPEHKWVVVESMTFYARYCYKCKDVEEHTGEVWLPSTRKLF